MVQKARGSLLGISLLLAFMLAGCNRNINSLAEELGLSSFFPTPTATSATAAASNTATPTEVTPTEVTPTEATRTENATPHVAFVTPTDGVEVTTTVFVEMAAPGLIVEPAGEVNPGAGHLHLLIDTDLATPGELIIADAQHLHYGQGQLTGTLELAPGEHTLRLQFADGAHVALEGEQYRDEITVLVGEAISPTVAAETTPHVAFVRPVDGAWVTTPVQVEMAAPGLVVEPAGEVHAGAGRMHILIDTDFAAPGELIIADAQHLHYGRGQLTTTLELSPGEHTLRLQFADGAHVALEGEQYRDEVMAMVGEVPSATVTEDATPRVAFVSPVDGAEVTTTVQVEMAAPGLVVEPAGEVHAGAGHLHILIDTDFVPPGELIIADAQHLHYGQGQLTGTLELTPGVHTLRLQFADGAHVALDSYQYRDEITVTVR